MYCILAGWGGGVLAGEIGGERWWWSTLECQASGS